MNRYRTAIPDKVTQGKMFIPDRLLILDEIQLHAVLATEFAGQPYTSLIAFALTPDIQGLIFITPKSTRKYKNMQQNKRVSLLIDTRTNSARDYMSAESVTLLGNAHLVRRGKNWTRLAEIFAKKHARLKKIISSPETALILVEITDCIHVTKFQHVSIMKKR
jgi:nitroimidazol reductase NimA-like FMN-containing flavoprotein (pyridoxamine 5'-phosphate oxidase superfamily)